MVCFYGEEKWSKYQFDELNGSLLDNLSERMKLKEISMGMSEDYIEAIEHTSTFLRIGSKIFGQRS